MRVAACVLFSFLMLGSVLFVIGATCKRLAWLATTFQPVRPMAITVLGGTAVLTVLTVFGMSVLETMARVPDWHSVTTWGAFCLGVYLMALGGTASYQLMKGRQ